MSLGNGNGIKGKTGLQTISMAVAEGVCGVVSLGALYYMDKLAPRETGYVKKVLSKNIVQPLLPVVDTADYMLSGLWKHSYEERKKMGAADRATEVTENLFNYGLSGGLGLAAKIIVRDHLNAKLGVPMSKSHGWSVLAVDEGMHIGTIVLMDTALSKKTNDVKEGISCMLQKSANMEKKKADELANYTVVWELPNAVGFLSGITAIYGGNKYGWFGGKGGH